GMRSADRRGELFFEAADPGACRQPARSQRFHHLVELPIHEMGTEERNGPTLCAHVAFRSTASKCVRRNGRASRRVARVQLSGAPVRARTGASVTDRIGPESDGKSAARSRRDTRRTFGLRGLSTAKSYQTSPPPGARTRTISRASCRR